MRSITVKRLTIRRLWNLCDQGVFAVPEIQREFVWDPRRASDLLDSIARQLPIGSLLIWKTTTDRKHLLRHSQENILPSHESGNGDIWFLIDGQQRLSVLHRAKYGHQITNDRGRTLHFGKLCLTFDSRFESRFRFIRKPLPNVHAPLVDLLHPNWRWKLRRIGKIRLAEAESIRSTIASYSVPVIFVHTNSIDDVREAFLRINSGGLRISKADRAFSKAARLDLRRLVKELRVTLPAGFNALDPQTIQGAMALIMGQREPSSKSIESVITKLEREEIEDGKVSRRFTRHWKDIGQSIQKAVDHLRFEIGLPNFSFLPSEPMLAMLAFFFHANNRAQPSSQQKREIKRWFWATAVGHRYTGRGYYRNIPTDLDFFARLGRRRQGKFQLQEKLSREEIRKTDYLVSSSVGTAFFLMLALKCPRCLETGSSMPLVETASVANRKDKHHIFPKALLARNGFSPQEQNSLCNICYLVAEENQSIGSNKPCKYLADYRSRRHFASVMRSHLIPHHRDGSLWLPGVRKAYRKFQRERLDEICRQFERVAGFKMFQRNGSR